MVVEVGDGVAEVDGGACGEAGRQLEDAAFAAGAGKFSSVDGAASQSMSAMGVVPVVPCSMNLLVKSLWCRNVPLLMSAPIVSPWCP